MRIRAALLTAVAALAAPSVAGATEVGHSGWSWGSPQPQGNALTAIDFTTATRGYASGGFGTVLRTDDGGGTWSAIPMGVTTDLLDLAVLGPDAFVAGGGCVLRRSDDAGAHIRSLPFAASEQSCPSPLAAFAFGTPQSGLLALSDGTVLRTDDGGETFARRSPLPGGRPRDIVMTGAETALAVTGNGIHRTTNGGAGWEHVVSADGLHDLELAGPSTAYALGADRVLLRSGEGGLSWEPAELDGLAGGVRLSEVACGLPDRCVIVTTGSRVWRTDDGGETVDPSPPHNGALHAAAWTSGDRVVAVGERGLTLISGDAGATFGRIGSEFDTLYTRLRATNADLAVLVGRSGGLARTTDGGATWTPGGVSTSEHVIDASFATAAIGFALDSSGTLRRTDNGGASWRILPLGQGGPPQSVLALSPTTVLLAGPRGIRRSTNGGGTIDPIGGRTANIAITDLDRAGGAVLAWSRRALFVSSDSGRRWRAVRRPSKGIRIVSASFVSSRTGVIVDDRGRIFRTASRGRRWREVLAGGHSFAGEVSFATARRGWLLLERFGGSPFGWLMRTDDGGRSFRPQLVSPTPLVGARRSLAATAARRGIAFSPGIRRTDDDYGGGVTLSGPQSFFATTTGGDRGRATRITLDAPRRAKRGKRVTVRGRLTPAEGGESIRLSVRSRGRWRTEVLRADSRGRFTLIRSYRRSTQLVAHWTGDEDRRSAGSRVRAIRVR